MLPPDKIKSRNIFLEIHPIQRTLLSTLVTVTVYFIVQKKFSPLLVSILLWDVFSLSFLILSWIILIKRPVPEIRQLAKKDEGSAIFVSLLIVISSFASMFTVLLLILSQRDSSSKEDLYLPIAIAGMTFSWI